MFNTALYKDSTFNDDIAYIYDEEKTRCQVFASLL